MLRFLFGEFVLDMDLGKPWVTMFGDGGRCVGSGGSQSLLK
jgi:hypothetical protein